MTKYKIRKKPYYARDGKTLFVPLDPDNRHYQAIQEWAKIEGNKIEDADQTWKALTQCYFGT